MLNLIIIMYFECENMFIDDETVNLLHYLKKFSICLLYDNPGRRQSIKIKQPQSYRVCSIKHYEHNYSHFNSIGGC